MSDQATGLLSPWLRKQRFKVVVPYLKGKILDFGCGVGELAAWCSPEAYVGLDIDPESLSTARRLHPGYAFIQELEGGTFDTIALLAVIEHVPNPEELLNKLYSNLSPGGRILITTPHPWGGFVHDLGARLRLFSRQAHDEHERLYDREAIEKLAGGTNLVVEIYKRFLFGFNQLFILARRS